MVKILIHSEVTKQKFAIPLHMPYHYMQKSMDYLLARMYQYVGKSENSFNIRLNNHRKDVSTPKATPACAQVCHYIFLMGHFS